MGIIVKVAYCLVASGAALIAYPYLTKAPEYHSAFDAAAVDALERPQNVKVLTLGRQRSEKGLQNYLFKTEVTRQYNAPSGFAKQFDQALRPLKNRKSNQQAKVSQPMPEYVVRFEGRSATIDVIVSVKHDSIWFVRQGSLRPFYSRSEANIGSELESLARQALPQR